MDTGHWQYSKDFNPDDWFGFVYKIVDNTNGMEYIGKKQFSKTRRKIVKNRKNRKVIKSESDWKSYTGSSVTLNEQIKLKGYDNFSFYIMSLHTSKANLSYSEVEAQIMENVLRATLPDGTRKFYNKMVYINIKNGLPDLSQSEIDSVESQMSELISENRKRYWARFKSSISPAEWEEYKDTYFRGENNPTKRNKSLEEYQTWLDMHFRGENNPMFGRTGELSPRYEKNPLEGWSDEQISAFKQKMSSITRGELNPRFGKSPFENFTAEQLEDHKKKLSIMMSGENNPMFGKPCTYKMSEEEKQRWKNNISKGSKGKPKSEEFKEKARRPKGPQTIVTCPHCGKEGGQSNMSRYHFDLCKKKPT